MLCEHALAAASRESGVPLDILYSVGLTETGHKGVLGPYDLNIDGRSVHSETLAEALQAYAHADQSGAKFIDIGCMQINHRFHAAHFHSLEDMFDPERNVRYAAGFLKTLYAQEGTWTLAVARYNAGPDNPKAQRTYVCAVIAHMVESGLGAWTPRAREFCG
jgi:Transglycosylase SLT domain